MFGYVKPDKDNLLVKDLALYKATYCGLCAVIKKNISFLLPFSLSYDFVFLAMVRSALTGERCTVTKGRCKYNPLKKCAFSICKNESMYVAEAATILTTLKLEDDLTDNDVGFFKKLLLKPFHSHLKTKVKKIIKLKPEYVVLTNFIKNKLRELNEHEQKNSSELDMLCSLFGDVMAEITAFGIEEKAKPIAQEIGTAIGQYIYLIDAIDDLEKDKKSKAYNPLITRYGSEKQVYSNIKELDVAMSMYAKNAVLASELLDESEYTRIIKNILTMGLGAVSYTIMTRKREKND